MNDNVTPLTTAKVKRLDYVILNGSHASVACAPLHDSAYRLWQRCWRRTLEELRSDHKLRADDFTRQNLVGGLFHEGKAVGLLVHTYLDLDLEAVRDHSYLSTYPPAVIEGLRAEGARQVFTMEYLTLDRDWRQKVVGVPLAEILLGLGAKVAEASGLQAMVVVTRNDRRVNEILYGYGARCLTAGLTKHNVKVDIVSLDRGKIWFDGNPEVRDWIDYFWARRKDATSLRPIPEAA